MERKNTFWLSMACAITFACAPLLVLAAQQGGSQQLPPTVEMEAAERDAHRSINGAYRLEYTLTEMDGNKKVGSQRYVVAADPDAPRSRISQQSTVHVGSANGGSYVSEETGIAIFAALRQFSNGLELDSSVSQTTLAAASPDTQGRLLPPEIRESKLSNTVLLSENKPVVIGQIDIPGTTHFLQIQVELTKIH